MADPGLDGQALRGLGLPLRRRPGRRLGGPCGAAGLFVETAVPERLNHYLRQQSRWNRSFFRETLWCLRTFPFKRPIGF